jgi:hypothetical protein
MLICIFHTAGNEAMLQYNPLHIQQQLHLLKHKAQRYCGAATLKTPLLTAILASSIHTLKPSNLRSNLPTTKMSPSQETQPLNGAATAFQTKAFNGNGTTKGNGFTNAHARVATDVDDLKDRLHVERSTKAFGSRAISLVDLPAGSLFMKITKATPATKGRFEIMLPPSVTLPLLFYLITNHEPSLHIRPNLGEHSHRTKQRPRFH